MKKVVVVVSPKLTLHKLDKMTSVDFRTEEFKGKDLKIIDTSAGSISGIGKMLIIKDEDEEIAVFQHWMYWKKLE